jgi:oligopeptide/dipeptide ABC transporter ATP-binding protein
MIAMALACAPADHRRRADHRARRDDPGPDPANLLERLVTDQDLGLLMISHDLAVLADLCDRLVVMYAGRVIEEGPAREVYANALHPYAKALSASFPHIGDPASRFAPRGLPGDPPDPTELPSGCAFHPRCAEALDACTTDDQLLREAGQGRRAACVHVRELTAVPRAGTGRGHGEYAMTTTTPPAPLLSAQGLHVAFPARHGGAPARAVDGVDLDIRPGEIVALVGESGCGKTTLARSLLGLVAPTEGRVTFDGQPLRYSSRALKAYRRRVQLVLQDPSGSLNPRHTVYDAVAEGLRIHGGAGDERAAVAQALSRAGLRPPERFFLRYPHELSGGQRQRVVIAGALVLEPELLVADEPVASLDASVRGEILALLLRLRTELGLAALVVTHDLGLAWNIADRVAVMYLGRIVETGDAETSTDGASTPVHPGPVVGPARGAGRSRRPLRRAPGPVPHPDGLPLPGALPDPGERGGGAGGCRAPVPDRGPGGAGRRRGGAGGVSLGAGEDRAAETSPERRLFVRHPTAGPRCSPAMTRTDTPPAWDERTQLSTFLDYVRDRPPTPNSRRPSPQATRPRRTATRAPLMTPRADSRSAVGNQFTATATWTLGKVSKSSAYIADHVTYDRTDRGARASTSAVLNPLRGNQARLRVRRRQ